MSKLEIKYRKLSDLKPYDNNPRINEQSVDAVANSISEFGFKVPMIIDKNDVIVSGHTRRLAALKLGIEEVPTVSAEDLTDEQIKALRIADNKVGENSEWDLNKLKKELDAITNIDMSDFNIDFDEMNKQLMKLNKTIKKDIKEDEDLEIIDLDIKEGDLYKLGNHLLYCGDSTKIESYKTLLKNEKVNLIFTDPPYGMGKEKDGVLNDNQNDNELLEFNKKWITNALQYLDDKKGSIYIWGKDTDLFDIYAILRPMINNKKLKFRNIITWTKGAGTQGMLSPSFRQYPTSAERCLFFTRNDIYRQTIETFYNGFDPIRLTIKKILDDNNLKPKNYGHYTSKSEWYLIPEDLFTKLLTGIWDIDKIQKEYKKEKEERYYFDNVHDKMTDIWNYESIGTQQTTFSNEKKDGGLHPTVKPQFICQRAIKTSSEENNIVLDVFGGSGSTLIGCEHLNRKCRCIELSPHWCSVIIQRWEKLTGKKAEKINTEDIND